MIDYGHGVELGPLNLGNNELYRRWRNNPRVNRWCRQKGQISAHQQDEWYDRQDSDPTCTMLEVITSTGECAGVCGLTDIDHFNARAEFSLYIGPEWQGQKLGLPALKTLVDFGFLDLNLNMIYGETVGDNPAQRLFEKVGFVNTGYRPALYYKAGSYQNSHIWCLLRDSYLCKTPLN